MSFIQSIREEFGDNTNVTPIRQPTTPKEYAGNISAYASAALTRECETLESKTADSHERNHQLFKSTASLSELVAGGELPETLVHEELTKSALKTGLDLKEIQTTLRSGYRAGSQKPRETPPPTPLPEPTTITENGDIIEASWAPIDLTGYLDGTYNPVLPSVMERSDGEHLLYPGMVHSFQGESESGKSMIAQAETARQIQQGKKCLYIDFESDAATVVPRLIMLSSTPDQIRENLDYVRPDVNPFAYPVEREAWHAILAARYTLVIIDGVTEAFSVYGVKTVDNDEVTTWGRAVPRTIAARTGAAVVVIDHVTKSTEGRGRFAIGAQAKMSYLTGASYMIEVISPIGVGMAGKIGLRVGKDRPGRVRPISGEWRKSDRTQETAVISIDSTTPDQIRYSVDKADDVTIIDDLDMTMASVLQVIQDHSPKAATFRDITKMVPGRDETIRNAAGRLARSGQISIEPGPHNSHLHRLTQNHEQGVAHA